jgi:hypothetical protein
MIKTKTAERRKFWLCDRRNPAGYRKGLNKTSGLKNWHIEFNRTTNDFRRKMKHD